jgi:hypothetical protein
MANPTKQDLRRKSEFGNRSRITGEIFFVAPWFAHDRLRIQVDVSAHRFSFPQSKHLSVRQWLSSLTFYLPRHFLTIAASDMRPTARPTSNDATRTFEYDRKTSTVTLPE